MNDAPHPALLPAGLYDLLPPDAEIEAEATARLMGVLASHGYQRGEPPLVEFEETLLSGAGPPTASGTFRLMDPISHRMVGVRADMTPPIARGARPQGYGGRRDFGGQGRHAARRTDCRRRGCSCDARGARPARSAGTGARGARPARRRPRRARRGRAEPQGHGRSGRESWLRVSHRDQLYVLRASRSRAWAGRRIGPRRPLSGGRSGDTRA